MIVYDKIYLIFFGPVTDLIKSFKNDVIDFTGAIRFHQVFKVNGKSYYFYTHIFKTDKICFIMFVQIWEFSLMPGLEIGKHINAF